MIYKCSVCGEIHENLPDIASDSPWHYFQISENERNQRALLWPDFCVIDEKDFFIRGVIEIPLIDTPGSFAFGVWVSQRKENFVTYYNNPNAKDIGPYFGWLCTQLSIYSQETLYLKTMVYFRGNELRPLIVLEETNHPLCKEQKNGIKLSRAWEIVHYYTPDMNTL